MGPWALIKRVYYSQKLSTVDDRMASGAPETINSAIIDIEKVSEVYPELVKGYAPNLIECLNSDDTSIRITACSALSNIAAQYPEEVKGGVNGLYQCLNHPNDNVRSKALQALGRIGKRYPSTFELSRISKCYTDESAIVRQNAIVTTGQVVNNDENSTTIPSPESFAQLLNDDSFAVRENSVIALGNLAKETRDAREAIGMLVVDELRDLLQNDVESIRYNCALALGHLNDKEQLSLLRRRRDMEPSEHVKAALERAIELIEKPPDQKTESETNPGERFDVSTSDTQIYRG